MNDFTSMVLIVALPPAAIECLALVWAKGRLRTGLAVVVPLIPLGILVWLRLTVNGSGDDLSRLGIAILALILLGGAVAGAVLGGIVVALRHLRRKQVAS